MSSYSYDQAIALAAQKWGISLKRMGQECHGPCPQCGGEDRFWVNPNGHYYCRQCHLDGWLDDKRKISPEEVKAAIEAEAKRQAEILKKSEEWVEGFKQGALWVTWHDRMNAENIAWWREQGITQRQIDFYELGHTDSLKIGDNTISAYTIPIRSPKDWEIDYVHYRLSPVPEGMQKYYYVPGVPAREFYSQPGEYDSALVVEGAKKAMVMSDFLDAKIQVVGLPGMNPSKTVMQRVKEQFHTVWLALDPCKERDKANWYFKQYVPQAKCLSLPFKPDDGVIAGMKIEEFRQYVRQSK